MWCIDFCFEFCGFKQQQHDKHRLWCPGEPAAVEFEGAPDPTARQQARAGMQQH